MLKKQLPGLLHIPDDVPHAVQMLKSKGCFGTLLDAKEAQVTVTKLIEGIAENHPEWFSPEWQTLNERAPSASGLLALS